MTKTKNQENASRTTKKVELEINCSITKQYYFTREFWAGGLYRLPAGSMAFEKEVLQKLLTNEIKILEQNIREYLPESFESMEIFQLNFIIEVDANDFVLEGSLPPFQCIIPDDFDFVKIDRMLCSTVTAITEKIGLNKSFKNVVYIQAEGECDNE